MAKIGQNLRRVSLVLFLCIVGGGAFAQEAIVKHRATVRHDPSAEHPPIVTLPEGDDVEIIDPSPTRNYYHVRVEEGTEGWIYAPSLELVTPGAVPQPARPQPPATVLAARPGGVASGVNPAWSKPEPNQTSFDGPDGHCGATGDGGDAATNRYKNRTDVPAQYHEVTWNAVQTLPYPVAGKSLEDWTAAQKAQIQPYEGVAVTVVGYLAAIKVENRGSGESTNCHFTNTVEVDWHMPLVEKSGDGEETSIVVETTPRVRKSHPKWTPTRLAPWVKSDSPVRISGWTLLDPEHRAHLGKYRSTLWEIHPITRIEVFKDGAWVDADELP